MQHNLSIRYSKNFKKLSIELNGVPQGIFTIAEKFLQQLADFYKESIIDHNELSAHLELFFSKQKLKTNYAGYLMLPFHLYRCCPDVIVPVSFEQKTFITIKMFHLLVGLEFMLYSEESYVTHINLSDVFYYKKESIEFLNFLFHIGLISESGYKTLEVVIDSSLSYFSKNDLLLLN